MNTETLLLDVSSEMLLMLDAHTLHIVDASLAAHDQLGYPAGGLVGMPIGELECALSDLFFWDEVASSPRPVEAQGSFKRHDGRIMDVRKFAKRTGPDNAFYALRARPMRSIQRAEPEINEVGLHLAATLEATEDCILLTDNDGAILNMNRRFSELWPLPQVLLDDRDDQGIVDFIENLLHHAPDAPHTPTTLSQVIGMQTVPDGDTFETYYLQDGRVVECVSHPAHNRNQTIGRVFCYRNVTERKQHEQSLKEARDKAEQAMISKGQFLANMSHEIRTPMNAILGMLKLLHSTDLNARQQDYASKAEGAAQSLLGLLNDILDFSKIDAGKMELDLQPFSLDQMLRDLSVILSANLGKKSVDVLFDIDPNTPDTLVGDVLRLQQVLINLSGNAIKFTAQGQVVVRIKLLARNAAVATLHIAVIDSGIGIAPEHQGRIFEDFSQAEASTTRRFGGTGLGLSICKRLVGLMGGELKLNSVPGQGSNFHFVLDLNIGEPTATRPVRQATSPTQAPLQVLVVDDNATARELLVAMGQSLGWQVEEAMSGEQAIARIKARAHAPYHAIFMDWVMPGLDGWETLAQLREILAKESNPITVMVTAQGRETLTQRSLQEQTSLNAFLVKPITASMMLDAVADAQAGYSNLRTRVREATPQTPQSLQGMRLLVVEDNLINQQVARELLAGQGALVSLADNGALGVAAVAAANQTLAFHAVLMDVQMPVMDGLAATRAIRQELGLTELPIIAMTANAMAADRDACLQAGMNDHVGKPFNLQHLVQVLLRSTQQQAPVSTPASL